MIIATARALGTEKARSSVLAAVDNNRPGRNGVATPMTPDSRTTGTTGMSVRNRAGKSTRSGPRVSAKIFGIGPIRCDIYAPVTPSAPATSKPHEDVNAVQETSLTD